MPVSVFHSLQLSVILLCIIRFGARSEKFHTSQGWLIFKAAHLLLIDVHPMQQPQVMSCKLSLSNNRKEFNSDTQTINLTRSVNQLASLT